MSINKKFILWLTVLVIALTCVATLSFVWFEAKVVRAEASRSATDKSVQSMQMMSVIDAIMAERVKNSMNVLLKRGLAVGVPSRGEPTQVAGRDVPQLLLGEAEQSNNYQLVDTLTQDMGGTATLFVFDGQDYVRVSTNVQKAGKRATGTVLTPGGAAFKAITAGRAFYGQVDILGSPYLTGYAPMRNAQGEVIGIWYVGYSADLTELGSEIARSRILQDGFLAIVDDKGRVRMHSDNYNAEQIDTVLANPEGWVVTQQGFDAWGYRVVAAYSESEVQDMLWAASAQVAGAIVLAGAITVLLVAVLVNLLVARPMGQLINAIGNITQGDGDLTVRLNSTSQDEFGTVANGFDALMQKFQHTIHSVGGSSGKLLGSAQLLSSVAEDSSRSV